MTKAAENFSLAESIPDPSTDRRLLPSYLAGSDNERRIRHYKKALRLGMNRLTPNQREQILMHYQSGLRKTEIAALQMKTCSAVSKSIKSGEAALRTYIELYMGIYDELEDEFLRDDE